MPSIWDLPRRDDQRGSAMVEPRARMLQVLGLLGTPFPTSSELRTGVMYRGGKMDAMAGGPTRSEFEDEQIRKVSDLGLNLFGIFKGVKGATKAEKQALLKAQQMAREGADRDTIWNATLWYKGKDGKWRTEIDDSAMQYRPGAAASEAIAKSGDIVAQYDDALYLRNYMDRESKSVGDAKDWFRATFGREPHKFAGQHAKALPADQLKAEAERSIPTRQNVALKVGDVVEHPDLKAAYPSLFDQGWYIAKPSDLGPGTSGGYDPLRGIGMEYNTAYGLKSGKSVTLHELQHAVQEREGMARGGSPEMFAGDTISRGLSSKRLLDDIDRSGAMDFAKFYENGKFSDLQEAASAYTKFSGKTKDQAEDAALAFWNYSGQSKTTSGLMDRIQRAQETVDTMFTSPEDIYKRLLGEVDARNAQKRMDMTLDQRRQFAPWSTWDVPEADQIVRFGDGPAMMVAPKKLEQGLAGEPGYVYHATNADRLREILESGKLNTHKPWDFTEQDFWPDGSTAKRAYFGKGPENLWQFAPPEGQPVVIRAKESAAKFKRESTGDIFTEKPIGAKNLEFLGDDGAWHPLMDLNK